MQNTEQSLFEILATIHNYCKETVTPTLVGHEFSEVYNYMYEVNMLLSDIQAIAKDGLERSIIHINLEEGGEKHD